jgi:DNA-binding FadR family transcriptional regulator
MPTVHESSKPAPPNRHLWASVRAAVAATGATGNRSEYAAALLADLAERQAPGSRLGTKVELRDLCGVSVGTFNEAVKLAQSRGYIVSRPGPGGGIFAAARSPIVRLGNSVLALDGSATSVADAVRMRDALDPLLVEDALRHSSAADLEVMHGSLADMREAMEAKDPIAFIRANWALHAHIAKVSPSPILKFVYLSLLELIEGHTLAVRESADEPLPSFIAYRYDLHARLVDAIERRDGDDALRLIKEHNTTNPGHRPNGS